MWAKIYEKKRRKGAADFFSLRLNKQVNKIRINIVDIGVLYVVYIHSSRAKFP